MPPESDLFPDAPPAVLRVWRGAATPANLPAYLRHLRARVEPALASLDGYLGVAVLTRPAGDLVEILVMTRWRSRAAIAAFAGPDLEAAVVEAEARAVLAEYDRVVRHFDVALEATSD